MDQNSTPTTPILNQDENVGHLNPLQESSKNKWILSSLLLQQPYNRAFRKKNTKQ